MPQNSTKPILRYPYTAFTEKTDYLQIDVIEYTAIKSTNAARNIKVDEFVAPYANSDEAVKQTKNISTTSITARAGGIRQNSNKASKATILLPIPSSISDSNSVSYQSSNLNSIAGAAVGAVMDTMGTGGDYVDKAGNVDIVNGLNSTFGTLSAGADKIKNAAGGIDGASGFVTRGLASKAVGIAGINITPAQILARSTGQILNPNMELLFNGPSLRTFRFQFKFVPRGPKEAEEIRNIIRTFKYHMAPKVDEQTFLKTPDIFELRYRQGGKPHSFLNKFKQCFLSSVNVNYTGEGNYTTYDDGTPVSMIMDLTFQELEPIYNTDYEKIRQGPRTGVGY